MEKHNNNDGKKNVKVLFVCTGNICRSPTADGLLREKIQEKQLQDIIQVDSAGLIGYHVGSAPDKRTQAVAKEHGSDLSRLRARLFEKIDFATFDLIIGMDQGHIEELRRISASEAEREKIKLFLDYSVNHKGKSVPDPYYGDKNDFVAVFDMIQATMPSLLETCIELFEFKNHSLRNMK